MEILYRCKKCKMEFRLDEHEACRCPKCGGTDARVMQRFYCCASSPADGVRHILGMERLVHEGRR